MLWLGVVLLGLLAGRGAWGDEGRVSVGMGLDDWWCKDGLCSGKGRCRSDCEVRRVVITGGHGGQDLSAAQVLLLIQIRPYLPIYRIWITL